MVTKIVVLLVSFGQGKPKHLPSVDIYFWLLPYLLMYHIPLDVACL